MLETDLFPTTGAFEINIFEIILMEFFFFIARHIV